MTRELSLRHLIIFKQFWAIFLISFNLMLAGNALAYTGLCCGKCGGNMPLNIPGGGCPETHEFRFKFSYSYMSMDGLRDGTRDISSSDLLGMPSMGKFMAVPNSMDMQMLNLGGGYSLTDDLFAGLMFIWQKNSMEMEFNSMMQAMLNQDSYTMKSDGMRDTMLMSKYRLYTDDPLFPKSQASLLFSLSLPTGSISEQNSEHPLPVRQSEDLPYGMQLGSGTFDPSLGLLYQGSSSPWWWGSNVIYTHRFYDNSRDYRLGNEIKLDTYAMYQLRYDLLAELQLNGSYRDDISGNMDSFQDGSSGHALPGNPDSPAMSPLWDADNYGGSRLEITAGVQWQPVPLHILNLQFGVPVYQNLHGPQLKNEYRLMLTWYTELPTPGSIRYKKGGDRSSKLGFS